MSRNIFYVYIYLDPRKHGSFNYGEFHFDYEPFYVGKGKKDQWLNHLILAKNRTYNSYRLNKIRKIQSLGLEPKIIKYKESLTEQQAFDLEKKLIMAIGRADFKLGPLTNLTDGGDGVSGLVAWNKGKTAETHPSIARQAEKMTGRTKETHLGLASMAAKRRGRTAKDTPWIARVAEKLTGRTKETHSGVARQAEKNSIALKGRIPWNAGRTKETDLGVASMAEKMKVIMRGRVPWNKGKIKEGTPGLASQAEKMKGNENRWKGEQHETRNKQAGRANSK